MNKISVLSVLFLFVLLPNLLSCGKSTESIRNDECWIEEYSRDSFIIHISDSCLGSKENRVKKYDLKIPKHSSFCAKCMDMADVKKLIFLSDVNITKSLEEANDEQTRCIIDSFIYHPSLKEVYRPLHGGIKALVLSRIMQDIENTTPYYWEVPTRFYDSIAFYKKLRVKQDYELIEAEKAFIDKRMQFEDSIRNCYIDYHSEHEDIINMLWDDEEYEDEEENIIEWEEI